MSGVEGAEREDFDDSEAGVGDQGSGLSRSVDASPSRPMWTQKVVELRSTGQPGRLSPHRHRAN